MILSAQSIRKREGMVTPFKEKTIFQGMSYGLTAAGYDIRIAEDIIVPVGKGVLASSMEHFRLPDDVQGRLCDKSSWARKMLAVQNTVLEPGWYGYLTLELSNHGEKPIEIVKGSPIAQLVFHQLDEPTELPYTGKYQDQPKGAQQAIHEESFKPECPRCGTANVNMIVNRWVCYDCGHEWDETLAHMEDRQKKNQQAADREAEGHPDWWSLSVDFATWRTSGENKVLCMKLPPFDTFAFDRVSAVLKSIGKEMKDMERGHCEVTLDQYTRTIHPKLEIQGLRLPPPRRFE